MLMRAQSYECLLKILLCSMGLTSLGSVYRIAILQSGNSVQNCSLCLFQINMRMLRNGEGKLSPRDTVLKRNKTSFYLFLKLALNEEVDRGTPCLAYRQKLQRTLALSHPQRRM